VNIKRIVRIGFAAFALTIATSALALQPSTAAAACTPYCEVGYTDVAVKFVGAEFRPGQFGNGEDVAFEIKNVGTLNVPYPNIKLTAYCNYADQRTAQFVGSDKQDPKYMGIAAGTPAAPFLVTCPAKYGQSVSSVTLQSATKGDIKSSNDLAVWDRLTGGHSGS
jgi:hypothetical protein